MCDMFYIGKEKEKNLMKKGGNIMVTRFAAFLGVLIGSWFVVTSSVSADEKPSSISLKLAPEILRIVEGNQTTLECVKTMQARIKTVSTESFGPKGSRQLMTVQRIQFDGTHLRKDMLQSKFIGKETEPLLVEHKEGDEIHRGYFRPPPVGEVEIDSNDFGIDYYPPNNTIFVRTGQWSNRYKINANDLLKYQSARGGSLRKNVLLSAKAGYYFTTQPQRVGGDDCILLECDYANPESTLRIWVVPSKGYCVKKMQDLFEGKVTEEYITTLRKYSGGIWWFDSVKAKWARQNRGSSSELSVDSLIFNKSIDGKVFTIAGVEVPLCGTRLINEITKPKQVPQSGPTRCRMTP